MRKDKYIHGVIFCDCLECPYNDSKNDYTCKLTEIYLDEGDCKYAKEIKQSKREVTRC